MKASRARPCNMIEVFVGSLVSLLVVHSLATTRTVPPGTRERRAALCSADGTIAKRLCRQDQRTDLIPQQPGWSGSDRLRWYSSSMSSTFASSSHLRLDPDLTIDSYHSLSVASTRMLYGAAILSLTQHSGREQRLMTVLETSETSSAAGTDGCRRTVLHKTCQIHHCAADIISWLCWSYTG
jgi:hypothetical protein